MWTKAPPPRKLPALYVLDSIVKNVGTPYTIYLGQNLYKTFMEAYTLVDGQTRKNMEGMLKTWKEPIPGSMEARPVFPLDIVRPIENALIKARTVFVQQQQQQAKSQRQFHALPPRPAVTASPQPWLNSPTPSQIDHRLAPPLQLEQQRFASPAADFQYGLPTNNYPSQFHNQPQTVSLKELRPRYCADTSVVFAIFSIHRPTLAATGFNASARAAVSATSSCSVYAVDSTSTVLELLLTRGVASSSRHVYANSTATAAASTFEPAISTSTQPSTCFPAKCVSWTGGSLSTTEACRPRLLKALLASSATSKHSKHYASPITADSDAYDIRRESGQALITGCQERRSANKLFSENVRTLHRHTFGLLNSHN